MCQTPSRMLWCVCVCVRVSVCLHVFSLLVRLVTQRCSVCLCVTMVVESKNSFLLQDGDGLSNACAMTMEQAVKQAIDKDDAQQLYEVLRQNAKWGRIDSIIDNLYDWFRGCSCLHRYHRQT